MTTAQPRYYQKLRKQALELLGGVCTRCGFKDPRALQIDHVRGDGYKDYLNGPAYLLRVMRSVQSSEGKYQLLCANCNWIKKAENKENKKDFNGSRVPIRKSNHIP